MSHYGLIGKTLGHSWSPGIFAQTFPQGGHTYTLFEIPSITEVGRIIEENDLSGFNVTIPYKQQIIPLLDGLTAEAQAIGAVNTVLVQGKQLIGHNTDGPAFLATIRPLLQSYHQEALVLGDGGASKAVSWAFRELDIQHHIVSHYEISTQQDILCKRPFQILVNATPVGMPPLEGETPWRHPEVFTPQHIIYDLVYNPPVTRLLQDAQNHGAIARNGYAMLQSQARLAYEFWGLF